MTCEPLFRLTEKGTPLCTFSITSSRLYKGDNGLEKENDFFDIEAWSKLAESCQKLGHKGCCVRVVGSLKQERWIGFDGRPYSKVGIVAGHVEFIPEFSKGETLDFGDESIQEEEGG
jgi:single-strand DNA-binding protein